MTVLAAITRQSEKLTQWALPVGIIVVWEALSVAGMIPARVLPAPSAVIAAGWHATLSGELPRNIWVSFWRAMVGLVIGGSFGFALGLANGL
jgi:sulfonate transport system permease protein